MTEDQQNTKNTQTTQTKQPNNVKDWKEPLTSLLYLRYVTGENIEEVYLCLNDGEPDMNDLAKMSVQQAQTLKMAVYAEYAYVWQQGNKGEYGAWQYQCGTSCGGTDNLKDALGQASFYGRPIVVQEPPKEIKQLANETN